MTAIAASDATYTARLTAVALPDGKSAEIHLRVDGLDVDEVVGTVRGADTCTLAPSADAFAISCTPDFRTDKLTLTVLDEEIVLARHGAKTRRVPLPAGAHFVVAAAAVGVRDSADAGCSGVGGNVDVRIASQAELVDNPRIDVRIVVGNESVPIAEVVGAVGCTIDKSGDDYALVCETKRACTIRTPVGRIEVSCDVPKPAAMTLLLPCGETARFRIGAVPRTVTYH